MRFLNKLFGSSAAAPIGVDLGSASLKLAQVIDHGGARDGRSAELIAAADVDVPADASRDPAARLRFYARALPELLAQGGFRGRRVVLGLPASSMHLERVRIPVLDDDGAQQAIQYEASVRLPFHPSQALIRHLVAGEVYEDDERRSEVIVMATRRKLIDELLAAAAAAKLEVVGFNAEPLAIASCFPERREAQLAGAKAGTTRPEATAVEPARMVVDIGSNGSRVYVVTGSRIRFARGVAIGANHLDESVAERLNVARAEAKAMRLRLVAESAASGGSTSTSQNLLRVEHACLLTLRRLAEELELSHRYFAATFPAAQLEEIVFVGGAAAHARLCQQIADEVGLAFQPADPLARIRGGGARLTSASPQSAWTVAIGLSLAASFKQAA